MSSRDAGVEMPRLIATRRDFRGMWPDLRGTAIVALDLREEHVDWSAARLDGTMLLGCAVAPDVATVLARAGAMVFPSFAGLGFEAYRSSLYAYEELTAGHERGPDATLDARIAAWFARPSASLVDLVARAVHDATIEAAVARFVVRRRVVGVMGGHALRRDDEGYRELALLGRDLTRAGFTVATGGGPGVMEAAHLGAWCAPYDDEAIDRALAVLADAPSYPENPDDYVEAALEIRSRWPAGGVSLGVPTWVYANEPTTGFATHIAKYFTNSIREDGLLAIARSGVVYTVGGAGTEQEIFTDTAQNSLELYQVRSPMVFFGRRYFEGLRPELLAAVRHQAATFGWEALVAVEDERADVVRFVAEHDPDASGVAGVERRRAHRDA